MKVADHRSMSLIGPRRTSNSRLTTFLFDLDQSGRFELGFSKKMNEAASFLHEKANQLFRIVKHVRSKGISHEDLCFELEAVAGELTRKAVELAENALPADSSKLLP